MGNFRNIRTTQEHRMNLAVKNFNREHKHEGIHVKLRLARSHKNLPTFYDDIPPSRQRSWKKHRTVQHH